MERRGGRGAGIHPWPSGPGESKNLHFNKNPGDALVAGPGMGTGDPQCPVVARKHMNRGGLIQYRLISHCCTLRAGREGLPGRSTSIWIKAALLTPVGAQGAPRGQGLKDQAWGRGPFPPTSRGREAGGLTGPQMLSGHSHGFGVGGGTVRDGLCRRRSPLSKLNHIAATRLGTGAPLKKCCQSR